MARTEEERKAWGAKMKAAREAKKNAVALDTSVLNEPEPEEPIHVEEHRAVVKKTPHMVPPKVESSKELIEKISAISVDEISYDECGQLINACSAAISALSIARTRKQEQLDAGTRRAPCTTCGTKIDITKSGGFQILTIRDEHFQPKNVYFCSQNCLLARNMPSHAKAESERLKRQRMGATAS